MFRGAGSERRRAGRGAARATVLPAIEPGAPRDFSAIPGDGRNDAAVESPGGRRRLGGLPVSIPLCGRAFRSVRYSLGIGAECAHSGNRWPGQRHAYAFELRAVNRAGTSDPATATARRWRRLRSPNCSATSPASCSSRANALANNQPRLTRFLAGGPINRLTGRGTERQGWFAGRSGRMCGWISGAPGRSRTARRAAMFSAVGSHWRVRRASAHRLPGAVRHGGRVPAGPGRRDRRDGMAAGPYFAAKLEGQPLFFEGRLLLRADGQPPRPCPRRRQDPASSAPRAGWRIRMEGEVDLDAGLTLNAA